jgi:Rho GTPase-activating protein 1
LTNLAQSIQIENLLIPSSTYLTDRRVSDDIYVEHATGRRAFGARNPFPKSSSGRTRFPRVLRETTSFVLLEENITSEGLFRVPPHSKLRDVLKEAYDRGQKYIVWKDNGVTLPVPPYSGAEHQDDILAEVDPRDAYSVFMAAALIKAWYASLRQPIFPTTSYGDLKRLYGDADDMPDLERLADLFSPKSEWSLLPGSSREIVVRHLLPLLDAISARREQNKMTAENLAVCFAPALLCGPDQIEDAKMSSIIRKIFTHAAEMWSNGLREACGQSEDVFYDELKMPKDDADWEDPVEEERRPGEGRASLEEQVNGITLEDNEKSNEAYLQPYPEVSNDDLPPPLPPRTRVPSTRSSTDSTRRKPAPPLQVPPPRYSTVISDAPGDVAESPVTYAATTDGFAPRRPNDEQTPPMPARWDQVADEKSGTRNSTSISASASALPNEQAARSPVLGSSANFNIPKRKTLTAAQVDDDAERSAPAPRTTTKTYDPNGSNAYHHPRGGMALPGLTRLSGLSTSDRSQHSPKRTSPATPSYSQSEQASPISVTSPTGSDSKPVSATEFRRPSIPASANRIPTITGLARPVYPSTPINPITGRPPSKSTSLPVPGPKPRTVSPGLLHRMPSFESRQQANHGVIERKMLTPNKLNLKKQSVEDLRRLYEERAGTASVLVEAGRWNSTK